jgi:hypothetical protein
MANEFLLMETADKLLLETGDKEILELSPFILALSANFADGDATTFQLTAPAGKATSDFDAGKMAESSNPLTGIAADSLDYTEIEYGIIATQYALDSTQYNFRVYRSGALSSTYPVTPTWTVGTAGTASSWYPGVRFDRSVPRFVGRGVGRGLL